MASETLENQGFMFIKREQQELTAIVESYSINDKFRYSNTEAINKYDKYAWLTLIKRHFPKRLYFYCISTSLILF
jgi:hypothetical protein